MLLLIYNNSTYDETSRLKNNQTAIDSLSFGVLDSCLQLLSYHRCTLP